jgi:hypothetical protein
MLDLNNLQGILQTVVDVVKRTAKVTDNVCHKSDLLFSVGQLEGCIEAIEITRGEVK